MGLSIEHLLGAALWDRASVGAAMNLPQLTGAPAMVQFLDIIKSQTARMRGLMSELLHVAREALSKLGRVKAGLPGVRCRMGRLWQAVETADMAGRSGHLIRPNENRTGPSQTC